MTIKPDRRVLSGGMIGQITGHSSNSTTAISVRCAAQAGEHSIVTSSSDHGAGPAPKVGTTRGSIIPHECAWCGARKIAMLPCLLLLLLGRLTPPLEASTLVQRAPRRRRRRPGWGWGWTQSRRDTEKRAAVLCSGLWPSARLGSAPLGARSHSHQPHDGI